MCRLTDRRRRDAPARESSEGALSAILNRALVNWRFTTQDARIKLKRLSPVLQVELEETASV